MNTKNIVYGIVGIILLGVAIFIGKTFGTSVVKQNVGAVGDTQSTPKMVQISANMATNTIASFLNSDATDRYITSVEGVMTVYGSNTNALAPNTMSLLAATGTTQYSTTTCTTTCAAMNIVTLNAVSTSTLPVIIIGTSTASVGIASSTIANTNSSSRWWPSGSYLNFSSNITATTTTGALLQTSPSSADITVRYISY